jgi:germination protein M
MRRARTFFILAALAPLSFVTAACGDADDAAPATTTAATATTDVTTTATPPTTTLTTAKPPTTTPTTVTPATPVRTTDAPGTAPPTAPPSDLVDVKVYFLRNERLVIAHRSVTAPTVLRGAIEQLLAGPTAVELAAGMTTTVPSGTTVLGVDLDRGLATIDLSSEFGSGGGSLSMFGRVAEVVFTATQFSNVDRVVFWMDGEPIEFLGGEGLILTKPQTRSMVDRSMSGSVIIDTPQPGDTMSSPIRVSGEGDVYEAQFPIEIWQNGVRVGGLAPVTAGAWGTWGEFDVTIPIDAAAGPIEIVAYDEGGCGTGPECPEIVRTVVEVQFTG